jgi:hypothetical protein
MLTTTVKATLSKFAIKNPNECFLRFVLERERKVHSRSLQPVTVADFVAELQMRIADFPS